MKIALIGFDLTWYSLANEYLKAAIVHAPDLDRVQVETYGFPARWMGRGVFERWMHYEWRHFDVLEAIDSLRPDVVGFSCYEWNRNERRQIGRAMKEVWPTTAIVVGGPDVPKDDAAGLLEAEPWIDYAVSGEGEETFVDLVRSLHRCEPELDAVAGLTFRTRERITQNRARPALQSLDSIPSPLLGGTFLRGEIPRGARVMLETYRGCHLGCTYCYWGHASERPRAFSLDRVKAEVSFLMERCAGLVYVIDSHFGVDRDSAKEILSHIRKNNQATHFTFYPNPSFMDEEMWELVCDEHIELAGVGIQSTSKGTQKTIHRACSESKITEMVSEARARGLRFFDTDVMFGLPGDSLEDVHSTLDFATSVATDYIHVHPVRVLPNTILGRDASRLELVTDPSSSMALKTRELSTSQIVRGRYLAAAVHALHNRGRAALLLSELLGCRPGQLFGRASEWLENHGTAAFDEASIEAFVDALAAESTAVAERLERIKDYFRFKWSMWQKLEPIEVRRRAFPPTVSERSVLRFNPNERLWRNRFEMHRVDDKSSLDSAPESHPWYLLAGSEVLQLEDRHVRALSSLDGTRRLQDHIDTLAEPLRSDFIEHLKKAVASGLVEDPLPPG